MDNFFIKLQDANYSLLEKYFSTHWEKPVYSYSPLWVFREVFILKQKYKHLNLQISVDLKVDESLTPIICIREDEKIIEYQFIAPRNEKMFLDFYQRNNIPLSTKLVVLSPAFIPSNNNLFKLIKTNKQMIYDCASFTKGIEMDLEECTCTIIKEKSSRYALRKNLKECSYRSVEQDDAPYIQQVLNQWTKSNSARNKSPADVDKDLFTIPWAVNIHNNELLAFIGFRGTLPISYSFVVRLLGSHNYASHMIAKSLNYKSVAGGYNETSVWELYQCCKACLKSGIEYLNANGYSSNLSLKKFKERFAIKDLEFETYDWVLVHS